MRIGCIGAGTIGSLLVRGLIASGRVTAPDVLVASRSPAAVDALRAEHPGIGVAASMEALARSVPTVILAVRLADAGGVLAQLEPWLLPESVLLSTVGGLGLAAIETCVRARCARIVPSITQRVRGGAILFSPGSRMAEADARAVLSLLEALGTPFVVDEPHLRIASDLTSVGPALWAQLAVGARVAAGEVGGLEADRAQAMIATTLLGLGRLLTEAGMTPEAIVRGVAVPGGVTQVALEAMTPIADGLFQAVFRRTCGFERA